MDKLDRLSAWAIAALLVAGVALLATQSDTAGVSQERLAPRPEARYVQPDLEKKIDLIKKMLANDNLTASEELLKGLAVEFPYEGSVFMLLGELHMRKQNPIAAMLAFRSAIDLNPDFLDKRTAAFQGKKIKVAVEEAFAELNKRLAENPGESGLKEQRKTLYYMQRRIAGSCG
ncbi:MAG: hypothetical protein A2521_03755 [Deltaproteobacteria bacterium RIFOXYD12_FULL_57_12]|nr:MAG: hypothetical protein A2521_03755 [Deltaproteobacteria bacterium RIFOXYD12_FULL_57_12]